MHFSSEVTVSEPLRQIMSTFGLSTTFLAKLISAISFSRLILLNCKRMREKSADLGQKSRQKIVDSTRDNLFNEAYNESAHLNTLTLYNY